MKVFFSNILICGALLFLADGGAAQPGAAEPNLGPPLRREIVTERRYPFYVRGYRKPVVFDPSKLQLPEKALTARSDELAMRALCARAQGKVDDYLALLSPKSRADFLARLEQAGTTPEKKLGEWRESMRGLKAEFTHHVDFGVDEMIRYRLFDPSTGATREVGDLVFRIEGGPWFLFDEEKGPFFENWYFEGSEKRVEIRSVSTDPRP